MNDNTTLIDNSTCIVADVLPSILDVVTDVATIIIAIFGVLAYRVYKSQCMLARYAHVNLIRQDFFNLILRPPNKTVSEFIKESIGYTCNEIMHTSDDILSNLLTTAMHQTMRKHYTKKNFPDGSQEYSEVIDFFEVLETLDYNYASWKDMKKMYDLSIKNDKKIKLKAQTKRH